MVITQYLIENSQGILNFNENYNKNEIILKIAIVQTTLVKEQLYYLYQRCIILFH